MFLDWGQGLKGNEEEVSWKWGFIGPTRTHISSTQVGNRAIGRAVENSRRVTCRSGEWRPRLGQRKQVDKVRKQLLMTHKRRCSQISAGPLTIRTLGRENYTPSLGLRKHSCFRLLSLDNYEEHRVLQCISVYIMLNHPGIKHCSSPRTFYLQRFYM